MTLIDSAIVEIRKLSPAEQDALASELLERIESDEKWDRLLADPRSEGVLSRFAAEACADLARGDFQDGDPSDAKAK